jgi:hypothetical protein
MRYLVVIFTLFYSCGGNSPPGNISEPITDVHTTRSVTQKTSSDVEVVSKSGVNLAVIYNVEDGYQKAKRDALASGYTQKLEGSNYTVLIPDDPCTEVGESKTPAFKVRADNYDGTEFDLDPRPGVGVTWAAEMVASYGIAGGRMEGYVCPDIAANGTEYFMEHGLARWNEDSWYRATETHTTRPHPILPSPSPRTYTTINNGIVVPQLKAKRRL